MWYYTIECECAVIVPGNRATRGSCLSAKFAQGGVCKALDVGHRGFSPSMQEMGINGTRRYKYLCHHRSKKTHKQHQVHPIKLQ